ncbi:MAG: response regulator transcription factor [Saprospiraceae bacterium]|nr:response regulator transcription factor [Saprospiraceae bacterium]
MANNGFSTWWLSLAFYGLSLGLLMVALQFSRLRVFLFGASENWYTGAIAILFAGVGIWAGLTWNKRVRLESKVASPLTSRSTLMQQLGITPREFEVLEHMAKGLSNQEIAQSLFVSLNTVKTHLSNLFSKLGVQRRTQAIKKAKDLGILP